MALNSANCVSGRHDSWFGASAFSRTTPASPANQYSLSFDGVDRAGARGLADLGGAPPFRIDAHQTQAAHGRGHGLAGDDLAVGEDSGDP